MEKNNQYKYKDPDVFESWTDVNIFFPIAEILVDILYNMGLTPNMITILSTFFTLLSIYLLHIEKREHAVASYLFGYILDCVDGMMARKYSMSSNTGMALDTVSDSISNYFLIAYIILSRNFDNKLYLCMGIIFMSMMLSLSYGINEAVSSYEATGSDNFYKRRVKQLKGLKVGYDCYLFSTFLTINEFSYSTYRTIFPSYDEETVKSWLRLLKHFGPGNYCMFVAIILLFI